MVNAANVYTARDERAARVGAHRAVICALDTKALAQALGMTRGDGKMVWSGLPPESFALPILEVMLKWLVCGT